MMSGATLFASESEASVTVRGRGDIIHAYGAIWNLTHLIAYELHRTRIFDGLQVFGFRKSQNRTKELPADIPIELYTVIRETDEISLEKGYFGTSEVLFRIG